MRGGMPGPSWEATISSTSLPKQCRRRSGPRMPLVIVIIIHSTKKKQNNNNNNNNTRYIMNNSNHSQNNHTISQLFGSSGPQSSQAPGHEKECRRRAMPGIPGTGTLATAPSMLFLAEQPRQALREQHRDLPGLARRAFAPTRSRENLTLHALHAWSCLEPETSHANV